MGSTEYLYSAEGLHTAGGVYFDNHREWMQYDEYLEAGYRVGSGVVESSCGHAVENRMEGTISFAFLARPSSCSYSMFKFFPVIPAKAGIQRVSTGGWIPGLCCASPGMTAIWNISL